MLDPTLKHWAILRCPFGTGQMPRLHIGTAGRGLGDFSAEKRSVRLAHPIDGGADRPFSQVY